MANRLRLPLEHTLAERGHVPLGFLLQQLAQAWNVGFIDLKINDVSPDALRLLPEKYARAHLLMPFALKERRLHVAMCNPRDRRVTAEIEQISGRQAIPYLAPDSAIRRTHLLAHERCPGAVSRLLDTGVEPFLLASTLSLVIAQRLVRRICVSCRESVVADASTLKALRARPDFDRTIEVLQEQGVLGKGDDPIAGIRLFRGKGCAQCHGSGFRGRLGVFELFEINDHIRSMIKERQDTSVIRARATAGDMKTMFQDGIAKAFFGETTLEEVFRVAV